MPRNRKLTTFNRLKIFLLGIILIQIVLMPIFFQIDSGFLISGSEKQQDPINEKIIELMEEGHVQSLSAAIIQKDKVIWSRDYGEQSSLDNVYMIGALTKIFTVTALMQLYEQGFFELDDDVNDYLPFELRNPTYPDTEITFRMLLSQQTSLTRYLYFDDKIDYMEFQDLFWKLDDNTLDNLHIQKDLVNEQYPHFCLNMKDYLLPNGSFYSPKTWSPLQPGKISTPNNFGFDIIGYLVELISNKSLDEYFNESIFTPLGMTHTGSNLSLFETSKLVTPYEWDPCNEVNIKLPHYNLFSLGSISLRSTLTDLTHFVIPYMNGGNYNRCKILDEESVKLMLSPSHSSIFGGGYGFGDFGTNGYPIYGIDNYFTRIFGYNARILLKKSSHNLGYDTGIIILTNQGNHLGELNFEELNSIIYLLGQEAEKSISLAYQRDSFFSTIFILSGLLTVLLIPVVTEMNRRSNRKKHKKKINNILESLDGIADLSKAISHPKRLQILISLLEEPKNFSTLQQETQLKKTALAKNLSRLMAVRTIERFGHGKYRIKKDGISLLLAINRVYEKSETKKLNHQERLKKRILDGFNRPLEEKIITIDPEFQFTHISYLGAISGVLKALGKNYDVIDVGGHSGYVFALPIVNKGELGTNGPYPASFWDNIMEGTEQLGYKLDSFMDHKSFPVFARRLTIEDEKRAKILFNLVKSEIEKNRPVIMYGLYYPSYGIIKGYTGDCYLVSTERGTLSQVEYPIRYDQLQAPGSLHAIFFKDEITRIEESIDRNSIKHAINLLKGSIETDGYLSSLSAYDEWAKILIDTNADNSVYQANSYGGKLILEGKRIATLYLKRMITKYNGKSQAKYLIEASKNYEEIVSQMETFFQLFPQRIEGDMSKEKCIEGSKILKTVKDLEKRALYSLQNSYSNWD